tara:strand:+ start:14027 stop:15022 length:996 start_codon:yes stop_codon:yes gene_type:complete
MIENQNAEVQAEDDIEIEITEDPVEESSVAAAPEPEGDELDRYTKSVSKRINKLNRKHRESEERAQQLERLAYEKEAELQQYRQYAVQQQQSVLESEDAKLKAQEAQVNEIYQRAVDSNDAALMSKADSLKTDIAIKKEKLNTAKQQHAQQQPQVIQQDAAPENYQTYQDQNVAPQQRQEQRVEPTDEALSWHEKNSWYGDTEDPDHLQATQFAYFTHYNLVNEGFEPDSQEYYEQLDNRVRKVYPDLPSGGQQSTGQPVEKGQRPAVQRVASAPSGGRAQTRGNNRQNGVQFSKSELERLQKLKPHNMEEAVWLKRVAKEKQKIAQRETT